MPIAETVAELKLKPGLPAHCARFREGRNASGVALTALVAALGMSKQALLQFELGKQRLDLEKFALACDLLGLHTDWVFYERGLMVAHAPKLPTKPRPAKRTA